MSIQSFSFPLGGFGTHSFTHGVCPEGIRLGFDVAGLAVEVNDDLFTSEAATVPLLLSKDDRHEFHRVTVTKDDEGNITVNLAYHVNEKADDASA